MLAGNSITACLAVIVKISLIAGFFAGRVQAAPKPMDLAKAREHWAFQPLRAPEVPRVRHGARVRNPVDAFLLAGLESRNLEFAPSVDRRTWLRRVTYDLTGVPPTYVEFVAFESAPENRAFEDVVDRLLSSPRYAERWGRHWLDVARYADTKDLVLLYGRDAIRPWAYTYRDYVIRAFAEDMPFDEFIVDQLAADLASPPRPAWRLAGLGFLTLGRLFDQNPHDQIDDQIDTVTRGFLGLTVACARCHDHKYDPIAIDDYYALYGVFAATERPCVPPLIEDPTKVPGSAEFEQRLAQAERDLEKHIDGEYLRQSDLFHRRFNEYFLRAVTTPPDLWETAQFGLSLIDSDFRPTLMGRVRRWIAEKTNTDDRILGLWKRLMELPQDQFSTQAAPVIASAAASSNPLLIAALQNARISNRLDVPEIYGRLFYQLDLARRGVTPAPTNTPPPAVTTEQLAASSAADRTELTDLFTLPGGPLFFPRRETPDHMSRPEKDKYGGMALAIDKLGAHASNRPPARAMVVRDLPDPAEQRVFQRGNPSRLGNAVPRALPRVLTGGTARPFELGSGRLELAHGIGSRTNPLVAKVFMNRVWMHHFGNPLVASPADFGARSEAPIQSGLLDWLATEFIRNGMRLKPMHRWMVLSEAYRQANENSLAAGMDPENRLLGWYPRRRLELEAMRDSLLIASGRLDSSLGGRPVVAPEDPANRRRTLYNLVDRQNLPGLFRAFDFAAPDQCAERRPQTMVPQQALFALNSPFVLEQAGELAKQTRTKSDEPRIAAMFRSTLGRDPRLSEVTAALRFLGESHSGKGTDASTQERWVQFAQVLLIGNESVFVD